MTSSTRQWAAGLAGMAAAALGAAAVWADWPEFRGPWGDGHVSAPGASAPTGLPVNWSETENVRWRTEIPHRGWSTPVVLGGRIWLTTATVEGNDFFAICVDPATGKILLNQRVFHCDSPEPLGNAMNGYASPSPAAEPGRVYVHFGSYGTACLDAQSGEVLWRRTDLPCRHYRGPGSSPILFENLLILTMDGVDVQYLVALDKQTGKTAWKTDRTAEWNDLDADGKPTREGDLRKAYTTPLVADTGASGLQLLSPGAKAAFAYDPRTGKELWKVTYPSYSAAARPLYSKDLALLISGSGKTELLAIRPDGRGDVTASHIAWRRSRDVPRTPSPIVAGDLFFMTSEDGAVTCLETATGNEVWRERIGGNYAASPILADGRIYFCSQQGKTTVIEAGRAFKPVATNQLESGFMASPAVDGHALILRTKTHLYRIEAK